MSILNPQSTINALRNLGNSTALLNRSLERLASGYKINRAADGAASLLISENLRSQIRGFDVAMTNAQQGLSMLQTADGAVQQISEHLQRIREIAVAASNATTSTAQFATYQADLVSEIASITNITANTKYDSHVLLNGSISGGAGFNLQIGPNSGDALDIKAAFANFTVGASGIGAISSTLASTANATTILGQVDTALGTLSSRLSTIGQYENTVMNQMTYLSIAKENTAAAESSIRNTDIASETSQVARLQLLQQAGSFALSAINASNASLMRLLQ